MKKSAVILSAALLFLCMTGCGDSADTAVSTAETTDTTADTTDATADTTDTTADTTETTADSTDAAADTTTEKSLVGKDSIFSVDDMVGEWTIPGEFGEAFNTMTVQKDGKFIVRLADGGTRKGQVKLDQDASTGGYSYALYDENDKVWIQYACCNVPVNQLTTTQESGMDFVRYTLEDVAAYKMENLNLIWNSYMGAGGIEHDDNQTITEITNEETGIESTFSLITDTRFSLNTEGKAAIEKLSKVTVSPALADWDLGVDAAFREKDGKQYILTSGGKDWYCFITDKGVTISDQTDTSFTATCNEGALSCGTGSAKFVWDGTNWVIDSYEFK